MTAMTVADDVTLDTLDSELPAVPAPPLTKAQRDALVEASLPLVQHVLWQIAASFPRHTDRDELAQAAALGLVEAAHRFDATRGVPFERWAAVRIRGAILDSVRALDFAPRSLRAASRQLEESRSALMCELGRTPTERETAARLGMTANELAELRARVHRALVLSLDAPSGSDDDGDQMTISDIACDRDPSALDQLESQELSAYLADAVRLLPERLRDVVVGYFVDGRTSADIAAELGVTESRVSQLRSEALGLLRTGIDAQYGRQVAADDELSRRAARRRDAYAEAITKASTMQSRITATRRPVPAVRRPRAVRAKAS
jgi:RNA polymerase sigma factor for flagellar operon FliA